MTWVPRVTASPELKGRVFARDYLNARGEAWERGQFDDGRLMDPVITDFRHDDNDVLLWLTFMAGSDWERSHRGRRFEDEATTA